MDSYTSLPSRLSHWAWLVVAGLVCTQLTWADGPSFSALSISAPASSGTASATTTAAPAAHKLSPADAAFLQEAQQASMTAAQGSKLVLDKSNNTKVRDFAQHLMTEHSDTNRQLSALAEGKGVDAPMSPSLAQRAQLLILSMREGGNFDRNYVESVAIVAHQDVVDLFQKAANTASDPDVRAFASEKLPTLQHDLDLAKSLQMKVVAMQSDIDQ